MFYRRLTNTLSAALLFAALPGSPAVAASGEILMASWPCLSPDGKSLVFEWRDDLWSSPADGGLAKRLTAHPARDSFPMFSPDGNSLYFCSSRAGFMQLFSMPAQGGPATQHSFHSEGASLEDIAPDGTRALVRGLRDEPGFRPERLIEITLPRESPEHYLFNEKGHSARYSPDGSKVLFCREGEQLYRKGYRGPRASSIWLYDLADQNFTALIKEDTEARSPMWLPDGSGFYYVSERDGTLNLWLRKLADGSDQQLTHFTDDGVIRPSIAKDGSRIVFRRGFHLWTWQPGGTAKELALHQQEDLADTRRELRKITGTVDADFSPSGLEIVFAAEGELWTSDTVLREPHRLTQSAAREDDPIFSPDGKWIYYLKDDGIDRNVWRARRERSGDFWWRAQSIVHEQVTHGREAKQRIALSPDGSRIAYVSGGGNLHVAKADGSDDRMLFACWDAPTFDWSPDSGWLVFAAQDQNFNRDIYIMPADGSRAPFNLSRHPDFEGSPRWSPDGRRISFTGRRLNNEIGLFYVDLKIEEAVRSTRDRRELDAESAMREDPLYRLEESDPDTSDAEEPEAPRENESASTKPQSPSKPRTTKSRRTRMRIDFEGLSERIVRLNTRGVEPSRTLWTHDSRALLFQSKNRSNDQVYRIEARQGASMRDEADFRGLPIRMTREGTSFWIVDRAPARLRKDKLTRYPMATRLVRDRVDHQRLWFRSVWRTLRDRFYDPTMNGRDWNAILAKYEDAAAHAPDSPTFDGIIGMMLGELNASHLTFISKVWPRPWENEGAEFQSTRHLGIRFEQKGGKEALTVASVIADSPAATCTPPIRAGDTILRVNGRSVDGSTPLHRFMNGRPDREIELVLRDSKGKEHSHQLSPIDYEEARELAEAQVVIDNRQRVEELSGGRLGYVHIARMFWDEFERFEREIYAAGHGKEGLVIDIRDNGGGFITDHLLTVLCQPRHAVTIPRGGGPGYPQDRKVYASWHKPLVVVCNQNSFSNAEIFAHAIKSLDRGPLVGVPTAGGVISATRERILDAGTLRVPFRGWFSPDSGEDMEMRGAMPDHLVWPEPGQLIAGEDPQLGKSVDVLLKIVDSVKKEDFTPKYRSGHHPQAPAADD
ncbi:MAG: PDZ domain-containing protein [Verrucomicrobia bacterium]|nr:MAG: PDZ domain-containing protein [Verrucomicrobiota bacterium]TAE88710.1 MAG: PDZ domain-containing protein [Verrucomicrobiota bacterium]TAF26512.1 MAG: PDZ domain-containing protein [Verrucomicrobiota bacterium]